MGMLSVRGKASKNKEVGVFVCLLLWVGRLFNYQTSCQWATRERVCGLKSLPGNSVCARIHREISGTSKGNPSGKLCVCNVGRVSNRWNGGSFLSLWSWWVPTSRKDWTSRASLLLCLLVTSWCKAGCGVSHLMVVVDFEYPCWSGCCIWRSGGRMCMVLLLCSFQKHVLSHVLAFIISSYKVL